MPAAVSSTRREAARRASISRRTRSALALELMPVLDAAVALDGQGVAGLDRSHRLGVDVEDVGQRGAHARQIQRTLRDRQRADATGSV